MSSRTTGRLFWILLALGLAVRVVYQLQLGGYPHYAAGDQILDSRSYLLWAEEIARGDWLGREREVFYQAPLYAYFLALLRWVFGPSLVAVRVVQVGLGLGGCVLVYRAARRLFTERAALVAFGAVLLFKPLIFYEGMVLKVALGFFLTALAVYLIVRALQTHRARDAACAGAALGALALVRENALVWIAIVPAFALATPKLRAPLSWNHAAAFLAAAVLTIAPATARNVLVTGELVLNTAQAGQNLYTGNHADNEQGRYVPPSFVRPDPAYEQADFRAEAERRSGRSLSAREASRFWTRATWEEMELSAQLERTFKKVLLVASGREIPDNYSWEFAARYVPLLRVPLVGYGWLLACGCVGWWLHARGRAEARLFLLLAGAYAATLVAFFVFSRYTLPLVPILSMGTAALVDALRIGSESRTSTPHRRRWAAAGVAALLAVSYFPWHRALRIGEFGPLAELYKLGYFQQMRGRDAEALATFDEYYEYEARALGGAPDGKSSPTEVFVFSSKARLWTAKSRFALGRFDEAERTLAEAFRMGEEHSFAYHLRANMHHRAERFDEAERDYRKVLELDPKSETALFGLGSMYVDVGRLQDALDVWQTLHSLNPGFHFPLPGKDGDHALEDSIEALRRALGRG